MSKVSSVILTRPPSPLNVLILFFNTSMSTNTSYVGELKLSQILSTENVGQNDDLRFLKQPFYSKLHLAELDVIKKDVPRLLCI